MLNNQPTYKIHGEDRRILKKELSELKSFVKNFWYYHQLDKDMCNIYGCDDSKLLSDNKAQIKIDNTNIKIKALEEQLSKPY